MRRAWLLATMVALAAMVGPKPFARAQGFGVVQSDVLVVDPERLFEGSRLGQAVLEQIQEDREQLIARNRQIEAELEAEEKELTDLRPDMTPEEFREKADAFDTKVQEIRRDSERRVRDLERSRERAPVDFMRQVEPILVEVMREAGAVVVMDARSVLLRADVIDITDLVIARIDATLDPAQQPVDNGGAASDDAPNDASSEEGATSDGQ